MTAIRAETVAARAWLAAAGLLLAATGCGGEAGPATRTTVRVGAAASLRDLMDAAKARFEAAHPGTEVAIGYDASSAIARQIAAGGAWEVFLSADRENVARLGGRVEQPGHAVLANRLCIAGRAGLDVLVAGPADLARIPGRLALAGPAVPAGRYARAWLTKAGLREAVESRAVKTDDVRAALALVEQGTVDAAFVYVTDLRRAEKARLLWTIPDDLGIEYRAALAAGAAPPARAFVDWLRSSDFQALALAEGFLPPP